MPLPLSYPKFRAVTTDVDGNIIPLDGGKLYSYSPGTSTPKATYTDATLGTPNANPVILDSAGEADVWMDGAYKFVLKDENDVVLWTVDAIIDPTKDTTFTGATLAGTLTITSTAITWSGNPTHSGNHTFSGNLVVNGNTTLGDAGADTLTVRPNAVTWTNNPTHSGNHTLSGTLTVNGAVTLGDALGDTLTVAASALKVHSDGRVSGNKLHNIGTVTGTTDQFIASGTYTPTLTNTTNVATSTPGVAQWMRVGNVVTVSGQLFIDPTLAAPTGTQLGISLPIASDFSDQAQCGGTAADGDVNVAAMIDGDTTNNRARMLYRAISAGGAFWAYHFTYVVV